MYEPCAFRPVVRGLAGLGFLILLSTLAPAVAAGQSGDVTVEPAFDVPAVGEPLSTRTHFGLAEGLSVQPAARLLPARQGSLDQVVELEAWNAAGRWPMKNGFSRRLAEPLRASLRGSELGPIPAFAAGGWSVRAVDGWWIWGTSIEVEGAWRTRLRLEQVALPHGTRFWVWTPGAEPKSFGLELLSAEGDLWTPSTDGELTYFEVAVPAAAATETAEFHFRIGEVLQLFAVESPEEAECLIDATCVTSGTFDVIANVRKAIAHIQYVEGSSSYVCSGGLLNDTVTTTVIPYFLTANHCISTQTVASSLEAFWDYRSSTCGGGWPNLDSLPTSNGATLLATSVQSDFAFLRLNSIPGARTLLGWSSAAVANGATLHRISHPYPFSFSLPAAQAYSNTLNDTTPDITCPTDGDGRPWGNLTKFHYSSHAQGGTYPGSSGSPVLLAGGYVVGQLLGACGTDLDGCSSGHYTVDGRFSATYPQIQPYINPTPSGGPCVPGPDTGCLLGNRFKVEITWTNFQGVTQTAHVASAGTTDSALFYWTNPVNWEVLIKAINACSLNQHYWIYFAAATNVGYTLTVTDTASSGPPKVYTNPVGNLAQATNDINAFATCP